MKRTEAPHHHPHGHPQIVMVEMTTTDARDDVFANFCRRYPAVAADPRAAQILISQVREKQGGRQWEGKELRGRASKMAQFPPLSFLMLITCFASSFLERH